MSAAVHPLTDGPTRPGHRPHLQVAGTSSAIDLDRAERAVAEHLCMTLRGVRATGSRTVTSTLHGLFRTDPRSRQEFLAFTGISR